MAFSINRATILGRATADPNLKYTPTGQAMVRLGIATSHSYKKDDEWVEVPQFTNCTFWRRQAEIISQNISKGQYLYVEGRIQTRSWEDQDGNKRYATDVQVENFVIPRNKGEGKLDYSTPQSGSPQQSSGQAEQVDSSRAEAKQNDENSGKEEKAAANSKPADEDVPADSIPF